MNNSFAKSILAVCATALFATTALCAEESDKLSKEDQEALAIGRAVLKLHKLAGAGAPVLSDAEKVELEKNVRFLSRTTAAHKMTWAWLEFRRRNDSSLTLDNNPGAKAIRQRLELFPKLLRKYFLFE